MTVDLHKTILIVFLLMAIKDLLIFYFYFLINYKILVEIEKLIDSVKSKIQGNK